MMMNIRGLLLDDPIHTIHLQTIQFAPVTLCAEAGLEEELVAYRARNSATRPTETKNPGPITPASFLI